MTESEISENIVTRASGRIDGVYGVALGSFGDLDRWLHRRHHRHWGGASHQCREHLL